MKECDIYLFVPTLNRLLGPQHFEHHTLTTDLPTDVEGLGAKVKQLSQQRQCLFTPFPLPLLLLLSGPMASRASKFHVCTLQIMLEMLLLHFAGWRSCGQQTPSRPHHFS